MRYSDEQVASILQRAAELQQQQQPQIGEAESQGMSLAEITQVAQEAGIDAALIQRAASDLALRRPPVASNPWVGAPTSVSIEVRLDREISQSEHELVVEVMQRHLRDVAQVSSLPRSLSWRTQPMQGSARLVGLSLSARDGHTSIVLDERMSSLIGALFGGVVGGVGGGGLGLIGGAFFLAPAFFPVAAVCWVGGVYAVTRHFAARKIRERERQLQSIMGEVVAALSEPPTET